MADVPPPPPPLPTAPPPPPEHKSAGMAAESSRAAENSRVGEQQPAKTPGQRIMDTILPPEALEKLLIHEMDPSAIAAERKQPALFKAAAAWGKLGPMNPAKILRGSAAPVSTTSAAEDFYKRKSMHFSGNHATFVKHLYEWMEARWEWLEKDTRWKTYVQMESEELIEELEKLKPGSRAFREYWACMLISAQWPVVSEDYEMEGLELDLIAAWLFTSSFTVAVNTAKKKPASGNASKPSGDASKSAGSASKSAGDATKSGGDASKSGGDTSKSGVDASKSAGGPSSAANGAPGDSADKSSAGGDNKPSASRKSRKRKKKKKAGTSSGQEPATAPTDSTESGAGPSTAAEQTPSAPSGQTATSSSTTPPGDGDGSSAPPANDGEPDIAFNLVEAYVSRTAELVQDYTQLPTTLAEVTHFKLLPEIIIINTLLVALDSKAEDIDSGLWDTVKKITSITADFRVAQRDFGDRLDKRFKAVYEKAEKAARKKRAKDKKKKKKEAEGLGKPNENEASDLRKKATEKEKEDQSEYEEWVEQLDQEAARQATEAGRAEMPKDEPAA